MSASGFQSSSKRRTCNSSSTASSSSSSSSKARPWHSAGTKIPLRRSRTTASLPSNNVNPTIGYANTRDNPLFDCSSSSSSPEAECTNETIRADALNCRRGRSTSGNSNFQDENYYHNSECGSSLSRDVIGQRHIRSLSSGNYEIAEVQHWEDRVSTDSLSESASYSTRNTEHRFPYIRSGGIYEIVHSEAQSTSGITTDLEIASEHYLSKTLSTMKRKNPLIISVDNVADSPSKFVNPDSVELVSDIRREYEIKLEQSQERLRELQLDLTVEEEHRLALSKILKNIVQNQKSYSTCNSRTRRKASAERIKISKRLAEEAMHYFDECVSLSTFDDSDFSSQDDQQASSSLSVIPSGNSRFFPHGCSNFSAANYHDSQFAHHEKGLESNIKCSRSTEGSGIAICSTPSRKTIDLIPHNDNHDDLPEFDTPRSENSYFSAHERTGSVGLHEIRSYIKQSQKKKSKSLDNEKIRSSYDAKDHNSSSSNENVLFQKVMLRNRIESGSMLICSIRTF